MQIFLVSSILGRFLCAFAATMSVPALWAVIQNEYWLPLGAAVLVTMVSGLLLLFVGDTQGSVGIRESFAIVTGAWGLASVYGALPYQFSGVIPSYIDSVFEAVSGLTTTGATVISDLTQIPDPLLLWRSMTHWLGGMGIIVLFIVLLPQLGVSAFHLFKAEVPGPVAERMAPRIRDTAVALWSLYVVLTIIQLILLMFAGMTFFDAVNHSFSTMSTGGFSTRDMSIAYYDSPLIEAIITVFMILSGTNFALYYLGWRSGIKRIFADTEFRVYLLIIAVATVIITLNLNLAMDQPLTQSFREALFQVVSLITTTGYMSADYDQWPPLSKMILLLMMFVGSCSGSTSGAIKVSRVIILCKQSWAELRKVIHPRAITSIQMDNRTVDSSVVSAVSQFFFVYILIFVVGVIFMTGTGMQPFDAIGAVAGTLGNAGPGFGVVGPTTTYAAVSPGGKIVLSLCMLLGRLELVTVLVFMRAEFWRSQKGW